MTDPMEPDAFRKGSKMIRYIAAAAALALAAPLTAKAPPAEGWSRIDESAELDHWIRDKDWMAGRPDSTSALVWVWVDHKRSRTISHEMILLEINCPAEGYRLVQTQRFDLRGKSTSHGGTEWQFATPSTIIGEIVGVTCMEPEQVQGGWDA
jgi:hypothetical protein